MDLNKLINQSRFDQYTAFLKSTGLSDSSIKRKNSSLSAFQKFLETKKLITPSEKSAIIPTSTSKFSLKLAKIRLPKFDSFKPKNKYLFWYLSAVAVAIILAGLSYTLYSQTILKAKKNLAYSTAASPIHASRYLSFQGRLTDSSGNPISVSTPIIFKLFDSEAMGTGTSLYVSSTGNSQTVAPDENGIFSVIIGKTHGIEIPASVFSENPSVFLEITAGGETMSPRQQIATVGYAQNAETLQGLPPSASGNKNTVMVIDNLGNLNLGETSPTIKSTSGTLGITGQAVLIQSNAGSGGNITLNPDLKGQTILKFSGANPNDNTGFIKASADANFASGSLYYGQALTTANSFDFLDFQNYAIGTTQLTSRFTVHGNGSVNVGATLTAANISIGSTLITATAREINLLDGLTSTNGSIVVGNGSSLSNLSVGASGYVLVSNGTTPTWISSASVGTTYGAGSGLTQSGNIFKFGGAITENTRLNIGNTEVMFINFANGNVGLGTTSPLAKFDISSNGNSAALKVSSGYVDLPAGLKLSNSTVANDLLFYLPLQSSIASSRSNYDYYTRTDSSSGNTATYTSDSGWITHDYIYNNTPRFEKTGTGRGVWVENNRKNQLQYSSFEDGGSIAGWTNSGLETFTTTTSYRKHQSYSAQLADTNATGGQMYRAMQLNVGQTYPFFCYVLNNSTQRAPVDASIVQLWAGADIGTTYTAVDGGWYKVAGSIIGTGTTVNYGIDVKANKAVYVDACQIESDTSNNGVPYDTTYIYNSGTNQYSRGEETLDYYVWRGSWGYESSDYILDANKGSASFWIKPEWAANEPTTDNYLLQVPNVIQIFYQASTDKFVAQMYNGASWTTVAASSAVQTFAANTDHYINLRWDATTGITLNVDGNENTYNGSWTAQTNQISTGTLLYVGSKSSGGGRADALISDFAIFGRSLTASEVAQIFVNKAPIEDFQRNDLIVLQQNNRSYQRGNIRITGTIDASTLNTTYLSSAYFGLNNSANITSHLIMNLPFQNNIDGSRKEVGTFTRPDATAGAATVGDETTLKLVSKNANEPRIDRGYYSNANTSSDTSSDTGNFGVHIEEARKNIALNSSFESLTGWNNDANITGIQSNYRAFHGTNSVNLTSTGSGRYFQTLDLTAVAVGTTHQISAYVYRNEANAWGATVDGSIASLYARTDDAMTALATTYTAMGNGWYRLTAEFYSTQVNNWDVGIYLPSSGRNVYVDAFQVERSSTDGSEYFPTTYIPTTNSPVTRAAESLSYTLPSSFKSEKGGFSLWFKPQWTRALNGDNTDKYLFMIPGAYRTRLDGTNDRFVFEAYNGTNWTTAYDSLGTNDVTRYAWNHLACGWYYNYMYCRLNGNAASSGTGWTPQAPSAQTIYIGSDNTGNNQANAQIAAFALFDNMLDSTQQSQLYNNRGKFEDYFRTDIAKLSDPSSTATQDGSLYLNGTFRSGFGTAAAPAYSFNGNTDTGIFSTGLDILGLGTSGIERIHIDSVGNVGIGTTAPNYRLEVSGDALISTRLGIGATNSAYAFNVSGSGNITGNLSVGDTINIGADVNLYRSAANTLRTDDSLSVGGTISGDGSGLTNITASQMPFSGITTGTNLTATMVVGTGASLSYTGTGVINASQLQAATWASPLAIGTGVANTGKFTSLWGTSLGIGYDPATLSGSIAAFNGSVGIGTTSVLGRFQVIGGDVYFGNGAIGTTKAGVVNARIDGNLSVGGTISGDGSGLTNIIASQMPFSGITTGINTTATMVVGTGASLSYTGTGVINASQLQAATWASPLAIGTGAANTALFTYAGIGTGATNPLYVLSVGATASFNTLYTSGSVGIGTSTPGTKLDVQTSGYGFPATSGSAQTYGGLRISPPSSAGNVVLDTGVNTSYGAWLQVALRTDLSTNYPLLLNPNGGNVGIGNSSPAYKLHVTGDALISTRLGIGATSSAYNIFVNSLGIGVTGNSAFSQNVSIGGTTTLTGLAIGTTGVGTTAVFVDASGNLTKNILGDLAFQNQSSLNWVALGSSAQNITLGSTLSFTGVNGITTTSVGTSQITFGIGGTLTQANFTNLNLGAGSSGFSILGVNSNTQAFFVKPNGTVGIGTTNPAYKLQVNGEFVATKIGIGATSSAYNLFINSLGLGVTGNSTFSDNLSIGKTLSAASLNIGGTMVIDSSKFFYAPNGTVSTPGYRFLTDVNTGIYHPSLDNLSLDVGGTEALRVLASGYVGIGTTNPLNTLEVVGTADIKTAVNSATAFQVLNSTNQPLFNVDTTNSLNLITNSGFEVDVSGWFSILNATPTRNSAIKYHGIASMQVGTSAAVASGVGTSNFTQALGTGTTYTLSFYARSSAGSFNTLEAGHADNGVTKTPCTLNSTNVTSGWRRYTCTFAAGAISGSPFIYVDQTDATARTFYIDAIQLEVGSQASPYTIGAIQLRGIVNAPATFQSVSDSISAFQIQNSAGTSNLFIADTLDNAIGIGTSSPSGKLQVVGGDVYLGTGNIGTTNPNNVNAFIGGNLKVGGTLFGDGSGLTNITASQIPFSGITSGTNIGATMVVGTGASLSYTGTGVINASQLQAATWASPLAIGNGVANTGLFTRLGVGSTDANYLFHVAGNASFDTNLSVGTTLSTVNAIISSLNANQLILGGGAGNLSSLGTGATNQVLHGNPAGAPTWGSVLLGTDTTGNYVSTFNSLFGNVSLAGGTDTSISAVGNTLYVNDLATLQTVTGRGATTTNIISLNGGAYFPGSGIWNASGSVGIGTTAITGKLQVNGGDLNLSFTGSWNNAQARNSDRISLLAGIKGRQINDNPDFLEGTNGYGVYDNAGSGNLSFSLIGDTTSPNASNQILQITVANGATAPNPGFGGFYKSTSLCSTTAVGHCLRLGNRNIIRIWAKIPSGYTMNFASNSMGTGGNQQWLSPVAGTGNWEEYITSVILGPGASSTNYFYITGPSRPVTWYVAQVDMIDTDQVADVDRAGSLNVGYQANVNLGNGQMLTTSSSYLATTAGSVGIGTTSPLGKLQIIGGDVYFGNGAIGTTKAGAVNARIDGNLSIGGTLFGDGSGLSNVTATQITFSGISSGTNTGANMVVGTGASLSYTGTGVINASQLQAATWASPLAIGNGVANTGLFTRLGVGSTDANYLFHVAGNASFDTNINVGTTLSTTTLTAVNSGTTVVVTNLNADLFDGYHYNALPYVNDATNATLTRSGSGPYTLGLNLGSSNAWTGSQTFINDTYFPGTGIWNSSGSVGIGTTTLGVYKLNVNGSGYFANNVQIGGTFVGDGSGLANITASRMSFSGITSGTNIGATMVVGTGASLSYTGTGVINASQLQAATWGAPLAIGNGVANTGLFTRLGVGSTDANYLFHVAGSGTLDNNLNVGGSLTVGSIPSVADNNKVLTYNGTTFSYIDTSTWDKNSTGNYSSWTLQANGANSTAIGNTATVNFVGGTNISIAKSGNTLTINNTAAAYTASNGISLVGADFRLGGLLTQDTDIGFSGFNLSFSDSGSTLASFNASAITFNTPTNFTASGDVSNAYDLNFTNQTASAIHTNAPFVIDVGENFESNNLTLRTYNSGRIVFDTNTLYSNQAQSWIVANSTSALNIDYGLLNIDAVNNRVSVGATGTAAFNVGANGSIGTNLSVGATLTVTGRSVLTAGFDSNALSTITNLTLDGNSGTALSISGTSFATDISLQNAETIDNDVDGTIRLTATNTNLTGNLQIGGTTVIDSNKFFYAPNGTAATPGYSYLTDTNSGLYHPALDNLSLDVGGTEALRVLTSGYVGIGTTSPTAKLTVAGSSGLTRAVSIDNREIQFRGDGLTHFSIFGPETGFNYLTIQNTSSNSIIGTTGPDLLTILPGGNIGIATTNPLYKLDVAGNANFSSNLNIGGTAVITATQTFLASLGTTGAPSFSFSADTNTGIFSPGSDMIAIGTSGAERLRVDNLGRVGIGITAPLYPLSVGTSIGGDYNGNLFAQKFMDIGNTKYFLIPSNSDPSKNSLSIYSSGSIKWNTNDVTGTPTNLIAAVASRIQNYANGLLLGVSSTNTAGATITGWDNGIFLGIGSSIGIGTTVPLGPFHMRVGSTEALYVSSAANIGIGTTVPLAKLNINDGGTGANASEMLALSTTYTGNYAQKAITWRDPSNITGQIDTRYNGTSMDMVFGHLYNAGYQTSDIMTIRGSGKVGIGTTNPTTTLQISKAVNLSDYPSLRLEGNPNAINDPIGVIEFNSINAGAHPTAKIMASVSNTNTWASELSFWTTPNASSTMSERVRIDNAGNVGIGTTSPQAKLDIAGSPSTLSNTAGDITINAASNNVAFSGDNLINISNITIGGTLNAGTVLQNGVPISSYTAGSGMSLAGSTFKLGGALTENMRLNIGSTESLYIAYTNGFVGIGTTSPNANLELNGTFANTVAGDVEIGYNLNFSNDTASYIRSLSPLIIEAGDANSAEDLTLRSRGYGDVYVGANNVFKYSGNVGINTNNPNYTLTVNGQPAANGYTAFTNYSDARLKTNITSLGTGYLAKVMELKPSTFNYNALTGYDQETQNRTITGFIAQDLESVFPEMVGKTKINGIEYLDTNLSALPVYLVKAIQEQNQQIAPVLQDLSLTQTGQISVDMNISEEVLRSLGYDQTKNEIKAAQYSLTDSLGKTVNRISQFGVILAGRIETGLLSAQNVLAERVVSNLTVSDAVRTNIISPLSDKPIVIDSDAKVTGSFTARGIQTSDVNTDNLQTKTASASTIYADFFLTKDGSITDIMSQKIASLREEIKQIVSNNIATQSANTSLMADANGWSSNISNDSTNIPQNIALSGEMIIGSKLTVIGDSVLGNAFITGTFSNGQMAIKDNFIETTNEALYIQPSGLGSVHILGETLVIADSGDVVVNGSLHVKDSLFANLIQASEATISGKLTIGSSDPSIATTSANLALDVHGGINANKINVATDSAQTIIAQSGFAALATSSAELVSNATAGTASLPAGKTEIIIRNNKITSQSMVYLTPVGSTNNQVVYLKSKFISPTPTPETATSSATITPSTFTIALDQPLSKNIDINWWIIN